MHVLGKASIGLLVKIKYKKTHFGRPVILKMFGCKGARISYPLERVLVYTRGVSRPRGLLEGKLRWVVQGWVYGRVNFALLCLVQDLLWSGPLIGTEEDCLGKTRDVEWHGVLVQVSEKMGVAVRVLSYKMLVEKDWIKHRHKFDSHQVLVVSQSSVAVVYSAVTAQPLQERHVFFQTIASQVQLITGIVSLLSGK